MFPKGYRLNNPGNIERGNDKWHGMAVQLDPRFITFDAPKWGIRAIIRIIMNYNRLNSNVDTVRAIINRWAPPVENNTDAYVDHVSSVLGVSPDDELTLNNETLIKLSQAIALHENGTSQNQFTYWYPDETYAEAVDLAAT